MDKISVREKKLLTRGISLVLRNNCYNGRDFIDIFDIKKSEFLELYGAGEGLYNFLTQNKELIKNEILNNKYFKNEIKLLTKKDILSEIEIEKQNKIKLMSDRELLEEIYRLLTK